MPTKQQIEENKRKQQFLKEHGINVNNYDFNILNK